MSLRITGLRFRDFRNYDTFALEEIGPLTVLIGRNGVGKTNILEGIQLLTSCESFRHPQIAQMIRQGCNTSYIEAHLADENRQMDVALSLETGKKRYSVNGKRKQAADVRGMLPAVTFTPDDLQLAKKSSSVKRSTLDELGMQLSRSYHVVAHDYEKALRYKNRLLKDEASPLMVESMNDTLVTCGAQLFCYRVALFNRMVPLVEQYYERISQSSEEFSASYQPSWNHLLQESCEMGDNRLSKDEVKDLLNKSLQRFGAEERARHRSLVGPHNDKVAFYLGGRDTSLFASQGQQRSCVLAWKLAEVALVEQTLGMSPVLLLDDVMSELDETRRDMLVRFVTDDMQTFITATDLSYFNEDLLEKARVVSLP